MVTRTHAANTQPIDLNGGGDTVLSVKSSPTQQMRSELTCGGGGDPLIIHPDVKTEYFLKEY